MKPFVSVIVPCRNEASFIGRCLESIFESDYPALRMEVIVADGRSVDGTRQLLDALSAREARLRVIDNPERITPVALNLALAASQGEILIWFSGHGAMPRDYVRRCVELLESSGADCAGGSIRTVAQSNGSFSGPIVAALSSRFGVGNSAFRTCGAAGSPANTGARPADTVFGGCWRRELFSRIGGFNERLERSQDIEFNLRLRRAGGTIMLDPSIVCDYYARADLATFWRHNFSNGVWALLPFALSNIVPIRARHLVPLAFVAAMVGSLVLPFPWSMALAAVYAAANLAASAQIALVQRRADYMVLMPIAFASLHVAYGLGSGWGCLKLAANKLSEWKGAHASRIET
jgi:glycosyltransferase involved in cell wall biosynthesis